MASARPTGCTAPGFPAALGKASREQAPRQPSVAVTRPPSAPRADPFGSLLVSACRRSPRMRTLASLAAVTVGRPLSGSRLQLRRETLLPASTGIPQRTTAREIPAHPPLRVSASRNTLRPRGPHFRAALSCTPGSRRAERLEHGWGRLRVGASLGRYAPRCRGSPERARALG